MVKTITRLCNTSSTQADYYYWYFYDEATGKTGWASLEEPGRTRSLYPTPTFDALGPCVTPPPPPAPAPEEEQEEEEVEVPSSDSGATMDTGEGEEEISEELPAMDSVDEPRAPVTSEVTVMEELPAEEKEEETLMTADGAIPEYDEPLDEEVMKDSGGEIFILESPKLMELDKISQVPNMPVALSTVAPSKEAATGEEAYSLEDLLGNLRLEDLPEILSTPEYRKLEKRGKLHKHLFIGALGLIALLVLTQKKEKQA